MWGLQLKVESGFGLYKKPDPATIHDLSESTCGAVGPHIANLQTQIQEAASKPRSPAPSPRRGLF